MRVGIVIDKRYVGSLSDLQPRRIPPSETFIFLQRNDLYRGKLLPGKAHRVVGGAIINQDDFTIGIALARQSAQAILQKSFTIPVNNDNANLVVLFSNTHPRPRLGIERRHPFSYFTTADLLSAPQWRGDYQNKET
jgi:hypothetical protein